MRGFLILNMSLIEPRMLLSNDDPALLRLLDVFQRSEGVTTDTRTAGPGQVFFALKGDNFNGNTYAHQALQKGCSAAVVDEVDLVNQDDPRYLLVPDVLIALQSLARWHRRQWTCPVIGLTGSNGKTTTKELIKCVLEAGFPHVHATNGNFNNEIGVPLTLLASPKEPDVAIIEMGANAQKEIALLASIAEPTMGLITNIGRAHLEGFGSEDGVLKGKGELFDFFRKSGDADTVFVNAADPKLMRISHDLKRYLFGLAGHAPFVREVMSENPVHMGRFKRSNTWPMNVQIAGQHNRENILSAIAIGLYLGISSTECTTAIERYLPTNNRSQWHHTNSNRVLLDAYNANPSSMHAAFETFQKEASTGQDHSNGLCIIGDMGELGAFAEEAHMEILDAAIKRGFDVVTVGPLFARAAEQTMGQNVTVFSSTALVCEHFEQHPPFQRSILLKGSRSIALEALLKVL